MTQAFTTSDDNVFELLNERFGSSLEGLESFEKLTLLATIAANLCHRELQEELCEESSTMFDTYAELPSYCTASDELEELIPELEELDRNSLLGLCESIVALLRYPIVMEEG